VDEKLPKGEKWTEEETTVLYEKSMTWCAEIAGRSRNSEVDGSRQRLWEEYKEFLAKNAFGVRVETAGPEDILAFIRGYWIPKHLASCRTTVGESKTKVIAVATVKQAIQHLSSSYGMLGRDGPRNPAKHEAVRAFKDGYRKMLHELGVKEKKAVVFKEKKMTDLVYFLVEEIGEMAKGVARCCAPADLAAILYLWEA
jgi:hypothetical protein